MIATRLQQKESVYYFAAYLAGDLLRKVRFISRYYNEEETIAAAPLEASDEIGAFIQKIERQDTGFQREPSKQKIKAIREFYQTADSQPIIPGAILLYSREALTFQPIGGFDAIGDLEEPKEKFLIIDGQHRLAALEFYLRANPHYADSIRVPVMIFDQQTDNFAAEMFVTINSTPTKINKSLLVDLYEKMSHREPYKACAAKIAARLYESTDSPLRYKINRLGNRSKQAKWIMQSELFNELCRWLAPRQERRAATDSLVTSESTPVSSEEKFGAARVEEVYLKIRDILRASASVFGSAWENPGYFLTQPVVLKAILRVAAKLPADAWGELDGRVDRLCVRLEPWQALIPEFRADGFYERFAAKGQVERVGKVQQKLERALA